MEIPIQVSLHASREDKGCLTQDICQETKPDGEVVWCPALHSGSGIKLPVFESWLSLLAVSSWGRYFII